MNKEKSITKQVIIIILLVLFCLVFLFPIFWNVLTSFKTSERILAYPPQFFPNPFTFQQFNKLFSAGSGVFIQYLKNTIVLTFVTILLVLLVSIPCSFGLSSIKFKGSNVIFILILSVFMVPFQCLIVPLYNLLTKLHLFDTKLGLILIYCTFYMPFCIFMLKNAFGQIPKSLYESAVIDGASNYKIMNKIYLPLCVPSLISCVIYLFIETWNDFILSFMFSSSNQVKNIQVGIMNFGKQRFSSDWGIINSGTLIAIIPTMIIFIFLQKYYVEGMVSGAVKG